MLLSSLFVIGSKIVLVSCGRYKCIEQKKAPNSCTSGSVAVTPSDNRYHFYSASSWFAFQQVKVSKDDSIILDGAGARDGIEERCSLLRESIARVKSDYEKEKLEERLAKLHSGVAVIKVGSLLSCD